MSLQDTTERTRFQFAELQLCLVLTPWLVQVDLVVMTGVYKLVASSQYPDWGHGMHLKGYGHRTCSKHFPMGTSQWAFPNGS